MTHRSVSQLKQYEKCPYGYYLERVAHVWTRPAAWLPHGVAFHEAAEARERSGRTMPIEQARQVFRHSYAEHINQLAEITPNLNWWFPSGKYHGEADIVRRWNLGLEQVDRYYDYTDHHPDEVIWISDDGTPGIELEFDVQFGGVRVRGFVDQLIVDADGTPRVRDLKTGRPPEDALQLGVYAQAIRQQYNLEITTGDYWMARTGKPVHPYDLTEWSEQHLADRFGTMDQAVREEKFDPKPSESTCRMCPVRDSCEYGPMGQFFDHRLNL
jgi:putative RecB family exonuclease